MRDYCKHWYTSCRCRRLAGVGAKLFVVLSLLLSMTASHAQLQQGDAPELEDPGVNRPRRRVPAGERARNQRCPRE
jgi:hypothetical protein